MKDLIECQQKVSKAYGEFLFTYSVTERANVDSLERANLVRMTEEKAKAFDEVYKEAIETLKIIKDDEVPFYRGTVRDFKRKVEEFRSAYGVSNEPNA